MSKRDTKNKEVAKLIDYYRKFSDQQLIAMKRTPFSLGRVEYKRAYNVVLKERGLDDM